MFRIYDHLHCDGNCTECPKGKGKCRQAQEQFIFVTENKRHAHVLRGYGYTSIGVKLVHEEADEDPAAALFSYFVKHTSRGVTTQKFRCFVESRTVKAIV